MIHNLIDYSRQIAGVRGADALRPSSRQRSQHFAGPPDAPVECPSNALYSGTKWEWIEDALRSITERGKMYRRIAQRGAAARTIIYDSQTTKISERCLFFLLYKASKRQTISEPRVMTKLDTLWDPQRCRFKFYKYPHTS